MKLQTLMPTIHETASFSAPNSADERAINYCNVPPPAPGVDLNWNPRSNLHSGRPAVHGPYDLGAYELPLGILKDRFEQP